MTDIALPPPDRAECLEILKRVVSTIAARGKQGLADALVDCCDGIAEEDLDLSFTEIGSDRAITQTDDRIAIEFISVQENYPYRADFSRSHEDRWCLAGIREACAACFAEGLLDGKTCYICEGERYM